MGNDGSVMVNSWLIPESLMDNSYSQFTMIDHGDLMLLMVVEG